VSDEDEFIRPVNTNQFQANQENGGRRSRMKNVSRINCLRFKEKNLMACKINLFNVPTAGDGAQIVLSYPQASEDVEMIEVKELRLDPALYVDKNEPLFLPLLPFDSCFNPSKNPISRETLANLLNQNIDRPIFVIDCRYDYEFKAGHIRGALSIDNNWEKLHKILFNDDESTRKLLLEKTILIFHCEHS
jgi:hypothetical protein